MKKIFFLLLLTVTAELCASPHNQQLEAINQQINSVKANLNNALQKRQQLQNNLQQTEVDAGKLQVELKKTSNNLVKQQNILSNLQIQEQAQRSLLKQEQDQLSQQIRASYILSRTAYLKLLLNQQDPSTINRILIYDHYISNQDLQNIQKLQTTLAAVKTSQLQINKQTELLNQLKSDQENHKKMIDISTKSRRQLIQSMSQIIQDKNQKLTLLIADKKRLEDMLNKLQVSNKIQKYSGNFASLQGHLSWPTKGSVLYNFGTQIDQSELTWTGTLIQAPLGQPVYAVASGKVVFAKWFSGYGLLLIIYHGNGFMTLYGRNQYLYKHEGDVVHQGEQIAAVGESGGFTTPSLYFAIRHDAKPLNPAAWCERS